MVETKRKARDESKDKKMKKQKSSDSKAPVKNKKRTGKKSEERKRTGPRLPNSLRKELERLNPSTKLNSDDEEIDSDEGEFNTNDLYEYQEEIPQEESRKNRRFDPVDNFEYELPEDFKDENVLSDDDDEDGDHMDNGGNKTKDAHDEVEEDDDGRHVRMLEGITGMPSQAFEGKKKKNNAVISEAYPESEYNPSRDVLDGGGRISMEDLLVPLKDKPGFNKLRKRMDQMKKSEAIEAPLPTVIREKMEREIAYKFSKKDIAKWESIVKKNREAPTIYFNEDTNLGFSTVGAIASEFEPRTEFEKKMASLVNCDEVMEAHRKDGSRLLELNQVSVEDEKERQNRIAKMRSLLFRHETKAKHIKKIKSKTYHRLLKKDRLKTAAGQIEMDPEAAKEQAFKQEFKRAEERMRLKHKNTSKWATRILQRGLQVQDEGTRAAIADQLHQHALLTRKMNSMKDGSGSSSDDTSDEDDVDENSAVSDKGRASKLLGKATEKTLKILQEEDEVPNSGIFSLPFMERGLKKRKEAAEEEAKLALEEYELSLKQMEDSNGAENSKIKASSGRRVFGAAKIQAPESRDVTKTDNFYANSDSDDDFEVKENIVDMGKDRSSDMQKDVHVDSVLPHEDSEIRQDSVFKSFDDIVRDPGPKTTYEVAIFASDKWRKMESRNKVDGNSKKSQVAVEPEHNQDLREPVKEVGENSDTESEGEMVDGVISLGPKPTYELPSQTELIRQAFAGDDVEEDFENDKQDILNKENPEPEKPVLLPGWGQWTNVQKKKGLPSWMLNEHEVAKRKREEALKKRKDAHLKHVIISEKLDKKAEKLLTKTLPYPFTSKEVFEQSIRMPIGPEFNPATALGELNRPAVVKRPGLIIKPIEFKEVNPHENTEGHKRSGQKQKMKNSKSSDGGKARKKMKKTEGRSTKVN